MRTGPDYIQFYPTLRCNRTCDFCFNRPLTPMPDMTHPDFIRMLEILGHYSVKTLDIMGGEPTLHPDIISMVNDAVRGGFSVNISSNGSRPDVLAELAMLAGEVTIGVSVNDRETLSQIKGFIATYRPVVKTVLSREPDHAFVREVLACRPAQLYLIYRDALERSTLDASLPFQQFISTVQQNFVSEAVGTVYCSGFLPDKKDDPELARVRCPAGTTKLGILPDGSVYPCNLFFGKKEFLLGNVLTDPFGGVWSSSKLDFFRRAPHNSCPDNACELRHLCHGGCPAHSYAHTGRLDAPDPRCRAVDSRYSGG